MVTILSGQKVDYETIDIATSSESKDKMRELMGDETALPPQIFRGEKHLGVSIMIILMCCASVVSSVQQFSKITNSTSGWCVTTCSKVVLCTFLCTFYSHLHNKPHLDFEMDLHYAIVLLSPAHIS